MPNRPVPIIQIPHVLPGVVGDADVDVGVGEELVEVVVVAVSVGVAAAAVVVTAVSVGDITSAWTAVDLTGDLTFSTDSVVPEHNSFNIPILDALTRIATAAGPVPTMRVE